MNEALTVVYGVVSNLTVHSGGEEFVHSPGRQLVGVGAAAGLVAAGMPGTGAGASLSAMAGGDAVDFFSCEVNGRTIRGQFSKASFKNDDEMTFVLEQQSTGSALALAARRDKDQVQWMSPHCSRGKSAHRRFSMSLTGWVAFALMPVNLFSVWASSHWSEDPFEAAIFAGSLSLGLTVAVALYYSIRFYYQWLPIAGQAERIFAALGYSDPSQVDLPRDHKCYCKANGIKWPYLTDGPWIYRYRRPHQ